jgi:hypothetical protein
LGQRHPISPSLSLQHSGGNCYSPVDYGVTGGDSMHIARDTYYPEHQLTSSTNSSLSRHCSDVDCTHLSSVDGRGMVHGGGSELDDSIHQSPSIAGGCKWEGCKYEGSFRRVADLLRHIRTVHISPGSYTCPVAGCLKSFNRRDNLEAHVQRIHKKNV